MIVLLNLAQLNAILHRVSDLHREVLTSPDWRVKAGGKSHRHDLPAIAWRQILDAMLAQIYGPLGGKKAADAAYTACARIQQGLMRLERHPALSGQAVVDVSAEVVPAFHSAISSFMTYNVYPPSHEVLTMSAWVETGFCLLRPVTFTERGWLLTKWVPGEPMRPGESRTFDPESHHLFSRHPSPL